MSRSLPDRVRWSVSALDRLLALGRLDRWDRATVKCVRYALSEALKGDSR